MVNTPTSAHLRHQSMTIKAVVKEKLKQLDAEVTTLSNGRVATGAHNVSLRHLYSRIELFILDLQEGKFDNGKDKIDDNTITEVEEKCLVMKELLHLIPIKRGNRWWHFLDLFARFIGVIAGFLIVGVFASLSIILLQVFDSIIGLDSFSLLSEKLKRFVCWFLLVISGIQVEIVNYDKRLMEQKHFKESCVLLTFSHSSNLDGFLVSYTCPVRHFALAKKELFVVPFFSWISLAFGGIPVDRENRERAVNALQRASAAARGSQCAIVVAPEGTSINPSSSYTLLSKFYQKPISYTLSIYLSLLLLTRYTFPRKAQDQQQDNYYHLKKDLFICGNN